MIPVAIGARFVLSLSSVGDSLKRDHLLSSSLTSFPRCAPYMGFSSLVSTDTHLIQYRKAFIFMNQILIPTLEEHSTK